MVALFNYSGWGETIEGVENPETGKRFTITGFQKRHAGLKKTKLEKDLENSRHHVSSLERQLGEAQSDLLTMTSRFKDWEQD